MTPSASPVRALGPAIARHSLGWLVAANLVGVWLAATLLWPALGDVLAPFTYGRWMPLHLDWQLYGWCSLPVVGLLLAWCLDRRHPHAARHAQYALRGWSGALALGGLAWLGGTVSGKLFLDWHGWARPLLPLAMHGLWFVLAAHTGWQWRGLRRGARTARGAMLALLFLVPPILFWASGREMYHPVDPDSGGATGAALLGSTLGIVTIFMLAAPLLGLPPRRRIAPFGWALGASWAVFAVVDRGHASHLSGAQIAAVGVLLAWIPLLPLAWRCHEWPAGARPWLRAATAWWAVLVSTGWVAFLPGIEESLKFTHALVAHAHLAMAGLLTSVNAALLVVLLGRGTSRLVFWLWQAGCVVHVAAMLGLGMQEAERVAELFRSEPWTQAFFAARLAAGVAMTAASVCWWQEFRR